MEKYVKTMVAVLLAVLGLSLTACSDDDDDDDIDVRLLATEWISIDEKDVVVFNSNNSGYSYDVGLPREKDYFTWRVSGKKLLMEYVSDYEEVVMKIEKLTQDVLVLRDEDGEKMMFVTDSPVVIPDKNVSKLVGKWVCYEDAYGDLWDEPFVIQFNADGTGYDWFMDEPFSDRETFTFTATATKIRIKTDDGSANLRYELSSNGKKLVIYGYDDNDMSELHFVK